MSEPRLRAVLVDDEAPARSLLREYLAADAGVEVVAECANGFEAVKRIGELAPDLVFLDVQMPKLDGFEVLELVAPGPAVVFCTAYDEFALRAFEVHAVDYLLKPFGRERLAESLVRVRERLAARAPGAPAPAPAEPSAAALAAAARAPGRFAERVIVRDGAEIARAGNRTLADRDPTAHCEMLAIRRAAAALVCERLTDCDLYVTLEPCAMCAAAISFARIRRLYYGAADPKGGAVENGVRFFASPTCHHRPEVYGGIGAAEAAALLTDFFSQRR